MLPNRCCDAVVTAAGRVVQRRRARIRCVHKVWPRLRSEQLRHNLCVALQRRPVQRTDAVAVHGVDVCTRREERSNACSAAREARKVQRLWSAIAGTTLCQKRTGGGANKKKAKERRGWEAEELTNGSAMRERKVERAGAWSHEGGEWESKKERGT